MSAFSSYEMHVTVKKLCPKRAKKVYNIVSYNLKFSETLCIDREH